MKFKVRAELGGYAASSPALSELAGTEIKKPFVLLSGSNGSGKTALLRMMRVSMGLVGEREGRIRQDQYAVPAGVDACNDDLGKLAAFTQQSIVSDKVAKDIPGVLDMRELGWLGQRSWLFDSRKETEMVNASMFDSDIGYHANILLSGGGRVSHGQLMRGGWDMALRWATGNLDKLDPYDNIACVPEARRELWKAVLPEDGQRSEERWLLLDEPEVALDAEWLVTGLCALLRMCEIGRLRVFCASHSPMFAAGLAEHPSLQVVDLGMANAPEGPRKSWFNTQKHAMEIARSMEDVTRIGGSIIENMTKQAEQARVAAEKKQLQEIRKAMVKMTDICKDVLLKSATTKGFALPKVNRATAQSLEIRNLARGMWPMNKKPTGRLTELGIRVANHLVDIRISEMNAADETCRHSQPTTPTPK